MDAIVLAFIIVASLMLDILGFMGRSSGWAIFPFFGFIVGIVGTLALLNDGNLTNTGTTIAAANGAFASDFNALTILAVCFSLAGLAVAIYKILT